jgi:hypothetical protein
MLKQTGKPKSNKEKIEENLRRWHEVLSEALWAHSTSQHSATKVTPFELVYGQEAMLPVEINLQTCRVTQQDAISAKDYTEIMIERIDETLESRLRVLREIENDKMKVAKAYNKTIREKTFQVGELVWKTLLPVGAKDNRFGKWSPGWEGPFRVVKVVSGNAYFIETLEGKMMAKALNGKYLKKYFPSVWQGTRKMVDRICLLSQIRISEVSQAVIRDACNGMCGKANS